MLTLCSKIRIGGAEFGGVHEVVVKRSIYELAATASIKVPVTAVLRQKGVPPTRVETARQIDVGDPVEIQLGYNGIYSWEFGGFVKVVNLCTPLEIICEDWFYQTRSRNVTLQGRTTLTDVLTQCGLTIGYCASLTLSSLQVDNKPVSWVLAKLKTEYGLSVFFDMDGRIYAGEIYKVVSEAVKYRLRYNVIKDDELKYHRADDMRLKIKAVCIYKDGTKVEASIGADDGIEKTLYFYDVADQNELAALADAELKRYCFDGYTGKIETFLWPPASPTMLAEIDDEVYSQRNGRYYIESVETRFGTGGGRRTVEIGIRL